MAKDKWYTTRSLIVQAHKVEREETVNVDGREVSPLVGSWVVKHTDGTFEVIDDRLFRMRFDEQR